MLYRPTCTHMATVGVKVLMFFIGFSCECVNFATYNAFKQSLTLTVF